MAYPQATIGTVVKNTGCRGICQLDRQTSTCRGCLRTLDEIVQAGVDYQRSLGLPIAGESVADTASSEE